MRTQATLLRVARMRSLVVAALVICASCAVSPPPGTTVNYMGETVYIQPLPSATSYSMSWPVFAFARGDSIVRGYVVVDARMRRNLEYVDGIEFEDYNGKWGRVAVDWVGLNVLSYERISLLAGPRPTTLVHPAIPSGFRETLARDGLDGVVCTIQVVIDGEGNVEDAYVYASSGYGDVDRSALDAAKRYTYASAAEDGRPVPCFSLIHLRFLSQP